MAATTQLGLFDAANLARANDPIGSHVAAKRHELSGGLHSNRRAVLDALSQEPLPVTSKELALRHGLDRHETARRLSDLSKLGLVVRCGATAGSREETWRVR